MQDDPGYPRYFAYLNLFVFFMLLLVLGANYPIMFIGWEGVGLCSYLLIGFWFSEKANADAGKKAFIVNRIGDFGFLIAMFLLFANIGTLDFRGVAAGANALTVGGPVVTAICLFLFLGCAGKSAQIPLYIWLPDAMAGPTPVSALIHAATMVTAGVYLIARSSMLFSLAPVAELVVVMIGALTAIFAASIGLKQWDIKKVLAYSTVSQLGYMFVGVGSGAYVAGMFHLATHAFFKALLFLGSGSVIYVMHAAYHRTGNHDDAQDMRNMGGLRQYMPITFGLMWIATLAIAGIPPLAGFFSKDEILGSLVERAQGSTLAQAHLFGIPGTFWLYLAWVFGIAAAFMTATYMTRMMLYTFHGPNRTGDAERSYLKEAPWIMTGPLVVLGVLTAAGGWLNLPAFAPLGPVGGLDRWLEPVVGRGNQASDRRRHADVRRRGARPGLHRRAHRRRGYRHRRRALQPEDARSQEPVAAGRRLRESARQQILRGRDLRRRDREADRRHVARPAVARHRRGIDRRTRRERRGIPHAVCRVGGFAVPVGTTRHVRVGAGDRSARGARRRDGAVIRSQHRNSCSAF